MKKKTTPNKKVITIFVEGGCVTDVRALPKGYRYQIIDLD